MGKDRPNIILFFTDQQRFDTIGAINNPVIKTPNLDKLARGGTVFDCAYSPSPVCVPARCCLKYGQNPYNSGCYDNHYSMPEDERKSFIGALTDAGYRTHGIGKCHFTPDPHAMRGFQTRERQEEMVRSPDVDEYMKFLHEKGFAHLCDPHGIRGEMYYIPQPAQMPAQVHPTNWIGDRSVAFLEEQAGKEPWFLFSSFVHPHPPFAPPNPWHKLYRAPLMPLPNMPEKSAELHAYINRVQNRYKYRDQGLDMNLLRCLKANYYACISFMDYQVGRIMETLEKTGQADNTIVMFTSDHGEHLGDRACFGKRSFHDSCARLPMIAWGKGRFAAGEICKEPTSLVDIAPTALAAAQTDIGTHKLDGVDLAEVASGKAGRETVFSQFQQEGEAIYTAVNKDWKYAYSAADDREYLIDRKADPLETRNRAGLTFCSDTLDKMRSTMIGELKANGESCALDGDGWKKFPRLDVSSDPDDGLLIQDHAWADTHISGYSE